MIACANLGGLYARGHGVPEDISRARALLEKVCREAPETSTSSRMAKISACANLQSLSRR